MKNLIENFLAKCVCKGIELKDRNCDWIDFGLKEE